ncbi:hypothetical protein D6C79_10014 [Aureobasidium pullulans]|nr:hypothetical protein D6C79_10014 [Aureobasidium pullulans]
MSISTLYRDALQKYGKLVLDFEEHASPLAPTLQAHSVGIKDEYGRLRIWGEQTRAVLPEKARHSLDEQLRENEQTGNMILRTLRRLTNHIETVNDQLKALHTQSSQSSVQSAHFDGCDDSSSSDESMSTQSSALGPPKTRICKAIESVSDSIRSLYRISALLKRPRNANKYLRSRNMMMPSQATLRAEEDHAHILEKMRQWRHLTMRSQVGGDEERAVTLDDIMSRKLDEDHELADIAFLCQRLTWANKLRRNQFKYWEESPDIPETQEEDIVSRSNSKRVETKDLSATQTSFSSVAISALAETRTEAGRLRTEYTNSVVDDMYFATSGHPGRLFITRHDWIYHEQQMHRRKWICPEDCRETFRSKSAIIEHIHNDHFDGLEAHQISTFADMCEREIDVTESEQCLICLETMSLFRLQQHLATHMEEIALFVLPSPPQDDEAEGNYDDLNEESFLGSENLPEQPETGQEELQALVDEIGDRKSEQGPESFNKIAGIEPSKHTVTEDDSRENAAVNKAEVAQEKKQANTATVTHDAARIVQQAETESELRAAFAVFDRDGDGTISAEDLRYGMKSIGEDLSDAEIDDMMKEADTNGDGNIDYDEFANIMSASDANKAPVKFRDAVDRGYTLPWHLAKIWKGMEALIKQAVGRIEHIGLHVADGYHHLIGPNNEIILPQV